MMRTGLRLQPEWDGGGAVPTPEGLAPTYEASLFSTPGGVTWISESVPRPLWA